LLAYHAQPGCVDQRHLAEVDQQSGVALGAEFRDLLAQLGAVAEDQGTDGDEREVIVGGRQLVGGDEKLQRRNRIRHGRRSFYSVRRCPRATRHQVAFPHLAPVTDESWSSRRHCCCPRRRR
jgi:hypothetical protein